MSERKLRHHRLSPPASAEKVTLATDLKGFDPDILDRPPALETPLVRTVRERRVVPPAYETEVDAKQEQKAVGALLAACESSDLDTILAILVAEAEAVSRAKLASLEARPTVRRSTAEKPKPEFRWPVERDVPFPQGVEDGAKDERLPGEWQRFLDAVVYREAFTEPTDATEVWATLSTSLAETWEVETAKWHTQPSPSFKDSVSPPPPAHPRLNDARAVILLALALAPYATRGRRIKNDPKRQKLRDALALFQVKEFRKISGYMTLESSLCDEFIAREVSKRVGLDPDRWVESLEVGAIKPKRDDFIAFVKHMYAHRKMRGGGLKDRTWPASSDLQEKKADSLADDFRERRKNGIRHPNSLLSHAIEGNLVTRLSGELRRQAARLASF